MVANADYNGPDVHPEFQTVKAGSTEFETVITIYADNEDNDNHLVRVTIVPQTLLEGFFDRGRCHHRGQRPGRDHLARWQQWTLTPAFRQGLEAAPSGSVGHGDVTLSIPTTYATFAITSTRGDA